VHPALTPEVRSVLTVHGSISSRDAHGGTSPARVAAQTNRLVDTVASYRDWASNPPRRG
jgi:argininosuccinate lyase